MMAQQREDIMKEYNELKDKYNKLQKENFEAFQKGMKRDKDGNLVIPKEMVTVEKEKIVKQWKMRGHDLSELDLNFLNDNDFGQMLIVMDVVGELSYKPKSKGDVMKAID